MKKRKLVFGWLVVILVLIIIYYFSDQEGIKSSNISGGTSNFIYDFLRLDSLFEYESFHSLVRKIAHFFIYVFLGFYLYNALFYTKKMDFINTLILSLILVFVYACSDEFHQLFVYGRNCSFMDVLIDSSGGSVGAMIYYFIAKIGCVKNDL